MTALDEADRNVERTGNALDLARQEVAIRQKTLAVAEEEESRRETAYKIAVNNRDIALRAEVDEEPA